jgi:hypothetical protein
MIAFHSSLMPFTDFWSVIRISPELPMHDGCKVSGSLFPPRHGAAIRTDVDGRMQCGSGVQITHHWAEKMEASIREISSYRLSPSSHLCSSIVSVSSKIDQSCPAGMVV